MSEIKNNIKKKSKKIGAAILDNYIRRLADTKKENLEKLIKMMSKFDERIVLTKLCSFLEHAATIDGLRNAHDAIVSYGVKALPYLEKLYQKAGLKFEALECIVFAIFAIGARRSSNEKLVELYKKYKDDEQYNLQVIIDMFELELLSEAVAASLEFIQKSDEHKIEFISMMLEFFEGHLEVEAWLRKQNDSGCRKLITLLDDYSESFENMSVTRDNIEFFKFEEFLGADRNAPLEEIIYCYEMSNLVANYITSYKEENDINFMPYNHIKGFVYLLMNNAVELIKNLSGPAFPILSDLDAEAAQLFSKDSQKLQYEKLYAFFWQDMKLIYGDVIKPVNIDYFAWRMLCLTYSTALDYIQKTEQYSITKDEDDEAFISFVFGVSEEIAGNIEEYLVSDGSGGNVFAVDEATLNYFSGLIKGQ
ncbi:MAG: hypothetical protein BWY32_02458 [bacterium ADurb.Bin243]|nr:MAG: hypothetical protein BWY32_02458 [bacterium ADurb.Bin243]